ncbi:FUSC family protein [Streptomyces malaysiense]|uniref:FUSC family protein n=1 Tax=Streptomyces malaysiense TaxID=1428626 RepID=UPI001F0B0DAF|nr:FUSC family protein [Streptomyces malaysiense]
MSGALAGRIPAPYAAPARRAIQVTLVAAAGFYLFRYGLDRPVAATYALFAAVALGGLSRIPGTGRQRAAVVLRLIPVGWLLVIVGTYLSVRTWSAVAGMLVVGFTLAFSAVGGPRPAGAAPGLQLLYILPSFPPYDPAQLGDRLLGTTTGMALLALAETLLFREPTPAPYRSRAAHAAAVAARCAALLIAPPYALSRTEIRSARETGHQLRPLVVPEADRPAGPSLRDRALAHTGLATRTLLSRLPRLSATSGAGVRPSATPCRPPDAVVTAVLEAVARLATATVGCLRAGTSPLAAYQELAAARAVLAARSTVHPREGSTPAPDVLRRHAAVLEIADAALAMGAAADLAAHGRRASVTGPPERFWYAAAPPPALWWHRVRGHAGRRSVFFQNAVRIALALTAARLVAGVDTLPHGFWATLATLTLTRTTMDETWSTIRSALAGTLAGALVAGGTLALFSTHTNVYAALLPLWMLFAFTVGPVKGIGWAQGLFTVLVALVFAQLAPPTWHLAEVRLLDVLVGSAIGAVFGLLAWPRGAHDELRYAAAELLRRAAEIVVATSASVALEGPLRQRGQATVPAVMPGHRSLQHAVILAESAYGQFQSEPTPFGDRGRGAVLPGVDWQAALMAGHHTLWGSERLLEPPCTGLGPGAAAVSGLGDRVAGRMLLVSAALDPGCDTPTGPVPRLARSLAGADAEPPGAPRLYYATVSWLDSLMADLSRIARGGGEPGADEDGAGEGRAGGAESGPQGAGGGPAARAPGPDGPGGTGGGPRDGPAGPGPVLP